MLNLLKSQPAFAGLGCGALSAALSYLSHFVNNSLILSIVFLILSYFSLVPIAIAFISFGRMQGGVAAVVYFVLSLLLYGPLPTCGALLINLAPLCLFTILITPSNQQSHHVRATIRVGVSFSKVALFCLVVVVIAMLSVFDIASLTPIVDEIDGKLDGKFFNVSRKVVEVLPGIITFSAFINMILNTYIANRLAQQLQLRFRKFPLPGDYYIPGYWDIVFVAGLLLQLTGVETLVFVGKNVSLIACMPLYLLGFSTVFLWLDKQENRGVWLGLLAILSVLLVWPGVFIVFLGLVEPTLKLQKQIMEKNK